jgi:hypothetical protein
MTKSIHGFQVSLRVFPLEYASTRAMTGALSNMAELERLTTSVERFSSSEGNLGVVDFQGVAPFQVQRVYWLYDLPESIERGVHAHKKLEQILILLKGSFNLLLDDGSARSILRMDSDSRAVHIPPGTWRTLSDFSPETVVLILASAPYDPADYIFDYEHFLNWTEANDSIS